MNYHLLDSLIKLVITWGYVRHSLIEWYIYSVLFIMFIVLSLSVFFGLRVVGYYCWDWWSLFRESPRGRQGGRSIDRMCVVNEEGWLKEAARCWMKGATEHLEASSADMRVPLFVLISPVFSTRGKEEIRCSLFVRLLLSVFIFLFLTRRYTRSRMWIHY